MSAVAFSQVEETVRERPGGQTLSPALKSVILEIAASERALDDVLTRASRLHESNIQHDPGSCLVCFGNR